VYILPGQDPHADLLHARSMLSQAVAEKCFIARMLWGQRVRVLAHQLGEPEDDPRLVFAPSSCALIDAE
jgi:hypothetical protein